jgi:hypothetical protein
VNTKTYKGVRRLTQQQELLLRAALLAGRDAVDAWSEWKSCVDIDDVDHLDRGSYRLLPLLYRNLNNLRVEDPLMMKLKGVYRLTWYKNQMLFHTIAHLLRSFQNAAIKTIVLKGAALTVLCYKDYGLRPMNDFDVLVHTAQALQAVHLLKELGWQPKDFEPSKDYISVSYSHGFIDNFGREFDLHWHLLSQCRNPGADDAFWEGAVLTKVNDIPVYVLNTTDQLLHICIHGAQWNVTPTFRWVADAFLVIKNAQSEIDWNRLIEQAQKRRLILPLKDALNYLKNTFDAPVPSEILRNINETSVPRIDRLEYRISVSPPSRWTAMLDLWCQHSRLMGNKDFLHKFIKFPRFLQNIWGVALWKLPFYGLSKILTWQKNPLTKRSL